MAFTTGHPAYIGRVDIKLLGNAGVKSKVKPVECQNRTGNHRQECIPGKSNSTAKRRAKACQIRTLPAMAIPDTWAIPE